MADEPYVVAGVDLRPFVLDWLSMLDGGGGQMRGLLDHVHEIEPDGRYGYGATMMMANIAPIAAQAEATHVQMLLSAVMATYQSADYPGSDPCEWEGFDTHVERAFAYFWTVGHSEAARRLLASLIRKAQTGPKIIEEIKRRAREKDPAASAHWERQMAQLSQLEIRAANLLDSSLDLDAMIMTAGLH